ncbi:TonB-dependent receptor domain-containing protein [Glacieibacterium megasporae]|uniref:TonB-dependent receptor domain-containing protein n=1 Tax=Glacieibacterium megasporae TaxID=2835787 RepID=UPI001C1DF8F7|nr:TonB-dependent receptor [Polymorphobacter megasporae]UAJ12343.1 TonB-dependent receptor [Polymorphobacter megasporae]
MPVAPAVGGTPANAVTDSGNTDAIVITGSRISRRDYSAESPIFTIGSAAIAATGQPSLDRVIGQMPQFEAAQGAAEVGDVQGSVGFGGGASYSDLRGIGRNRSLVLLDGHRLVPSTPDGAIDLNTIPVSLIENVEVITGGASAAYGSDAIAGVANFKLRRRFTGFELNAQGGASTRGDGATAQVSGILGGNFDEGRGHAMIAFEYGRRDAVNGSQRTFFTQPAVRFLARPPEGIIYAGGFGTGATAPSIAAVNAVLASYSGTTPYPGSGPYKGAIGINTDGTVFTSVVPSSLGCVQNYKGVGSVVGAQISPSCTQAGVILGNYFAVQTPLTRYNAFGSADYKLTDHLTIYGQFNFAESHSLDQTSPGSTKTNNTIELYVPVRNQFIQSNPALLSLINSAYGGVAPPGSQVGVSKLLFGWGNRVQTFNYDVWQALAGVKGDIPGTRFTFDVYGSFGRSTYASKASGDISISAINNVFANEGVGGCTYNPFGLQPVSSACLAYAGRTDNTTSSLDATDIELSLEGPLFTLPGGEAKIAVGADYRRSSFDYQPDSLFISGDTLSYGTATPAHGTQDAKELFGELLLPFVSDQHFAQDLSLDLGYRYSKYNSFAAKSTWKADLSWTVVKGLRLRGGYAFAFRAPSLADLYNGVSIGNQSLNGGDPCDILSSYRTGANGGKVQALCAAQSTAAGSASYSFGGANVTVPVQTGGNSLLRPETARTWSVGTVLSPVHGLNLSIDYYNLTVSGAISSLSSGQILANCYGGIANPGFAASNAFCQRIVRDANSGQISLLTSGVFNFNKFDVAGIDFQLDYRFDLDQVGLSHSSGALQVGSIATYLSKYTVTPADGTAPTRYAGAISDTFVTSDGENLYSHPRWKANSYLTYQNGPFVGTVRWRYIGPMANLDSPAQPVPSISYFDADVHYTINKTLTLSAGIVNIGDRQPPFISTLELRTDAATYDVIGRTFFLSAKVKL